MKIPIETSARHIHLSQKDLEKLFGKNYKLTPIKKLSQPEYFASKETVTLINKKNKIKNIRVISPLRKKSYVEISKTDAIHLKIKVPIKLSGDLKGTPKIKVRGKKNLVKIPVIIAKRHLHCSEKEAKKLRLKNKQIVSAKIIGTRGLIFNEIVVRAGKGHKFALHLDTDEANACGISGKTFGELIKK